MYLMAIGFTFPLCQRMPINPLARIPVPWTSRRASDVVMSYFQKFFARQQIPSISKSDEFPEEVLCDDTGLGRR